MKRILLFLGLVISFTGVTTAETTRFKQQILPIDCVYEVIDVGTQKLRYITPETCPVDPGPPVITEPPVVPGETGAGSATTKWAYVPPVAALPSITPTQPDDEQSVQGSIEGIRDIVYRNVDSLLFISAIVVLWWAAIYFGRKRLKD